MNTCECGCGGTTNGRFMRGHKWKASRPPIAPPNPSGLCKCGCGEKTKLAAFDDPKRGVLQGHPINYVRGHQRRGKHGAHGPYRKTIERAATEQPNPSGICWCGCGDEAPLAKSTSTRDHTLLGFPVRYIRGHERRPNKSMYIVEDRGYKTPCWIWQWYTDEAGYGRITRDGISMGAHRWFYMQAKGPIPEGKHLDHLCVVPSCVNPDHLEPVTPLVNNSRRRFIRLSHDKVEVVKQLHSWGATYGDIGRLFNVKAATIYAVCAGLTWTPPEDSPRASE